MGCEPQQLCSTLELANEFVEHIALGIEEARVVCTKVKDEPAPVFAPWDRVWLDGSDTATNRLLTKLSN
jgi:hypothetical protein